MVLSVFLVNSTLDLPDSFLADGIADTQNNPLADPPTPPSGITTLRAAIQQANFDGGGTIRFAIGNGHQVIVTDHLPTITVPIVIDGTTQPGYTGAPLIEIRGTGAFLDGLQILGGNSQLKGLVVNSFGDRGINILSNGNTVTNTYVGTDHTGTVDMGNGGTGIELQGDNNVIGGAAAGERNLVSGNGRMGVDIEAGNGNVIRGNYIGTTINGTAILSNGIDGVHIHTGSQNIVGVDNQGDGANLISGNGLNGVRIHGEDTVSNFVRGNLIGTNAQGTAPLPNQSHGVHLESRLEFHPSGARWEVVFDNTIGGEGFFGNLISGNLGHGVLISGEGARNNLLQRNFIGSNDEGTAALGNAGAGVKIDGARDNTIGGPRTGPESQLGNLISGNADGVLITGAAATGNALVGNNIGTDRDGLIALGNTLSGVRIEAGASANTIGVGLDAALTTGNVIAGNGNGVTLVGSATTGNFIRGNYIGVARSGSTKLANLAAGVEINGASGNIVGGASAGNVIAGNGQEGLRILGAGTTRVEGNFIGTNTTGAAGLGNTRSGVLIDGSTSPTEANVVGGTTPDTRNVISGNLESGVKIKGAMATGNSLQGNYIGTNVVGSGARPNLHHGVAIDAAPGNFIGGTDSGAGNVISGNAQHGILITADIPVANLIAGNFIGTTAGGLTDLGNENGLQIEVSGTSRTTIGGNTSGHRNVISGNRQNGVFVQGTVPGTTSAVIILGNTIGAAADGTSNLGNTENGIHLQNVTDTIIGGASAGDGNIIAFNHRSGVVVDDSLFPGTTTGNLVSRNSIFSNSGLGIELTNRATAPGDTPRLLPNDDDDTDTGANNLQNYPELTKVVRTAPDKVEARVFLRSTPSTTFTIEFFSNTPTFDTGVGETQKFLLSVPVTTNAQGVSRFGVANLTLATTDFLTLTVTDPDNNTSQISQDADGDALYDSWEIDGLDVDGDGIVDLDLAALGADPDHKDLFVEVDYIDVYKPRSGTLQDVIDAFDFAPVANPDHSTGITLHAVEDDAIPLIPAWEFVDLSGVFDTIKSGFFGTSADRASADAANILAAKRMVYRYAIFAKQQSPSDKASGAGELGGNDFVVTVGSWNAEQFIAPSVRRELEAGTFMHELGHTLNLNHGGASTDDIQYKPNYLSVLNYSLQTPKFDASRPLDYSREAMPPLDENSLLETVGIQGAPGRFAVYYVNGKTKLTRTGIPVDWNDNGVIDILPVQVDINKDGHLTVLIGHHDWPNLEYGFRGSKGFADGAEPDVETNDFTEEVALAAIAALEIVDDDFDNDGFADIIDNAPGIFNPDQASTNGVATVLVKKSATFLDQDGDTVTVSLKGPGEFTLVVSDADADLRGAIESIGTTGTTEASALSIVVKADKVTGNGRVDAASIDGSKLKSLIAASVDLVGPGVNFTGHVGIVTVRDVRDGASIALGGNATQFTVLAARDIGDGGTIESGSALKSLTAVRTGSVTITVPRLDKLTVQGDKKNNIAGDFGANLVITGVGQVPAMPLLGSAAIFGLLGRAVGNTSWDIDGAVGAIAAGRIANAVIDIAGAAKSITAVEWKDTNETRDRLTAAMLGKLAVKGDKKNNIAGDFEADLVITGVGQDPAKPLLGGAAIVGLLGREVGNSSWDIDGAVGAISAAKVVNAAIDVLTDLKSLAITPAKGSASPTFTNSNVTAHASFGTAKLGLVEVLNNAVPFGLFAPSFKLVEYTPPGGVKFRLTPTTVLPVIDEDFRIAQS